MQGVYLLMLLMGFLTCQELKNVKQKIEKKVEVPQVCVFVDLILLKIVANFMREMHQRK